MRALHRQLVRVQLLLGIFPLAGFRLFHIRRTFTMGFVSALKRGRTPFAVLKQFCPESIRLFIKAWNVVRGTRIPKSDIWRFTSFDLHLADLLGS